MLTKKYNNKKQLIVTLRTATFLETNIETPNVGLQFWETTLETTNVGLRNLPIYLFYQKTKTIMAFKK